MTTKVFLIEIAQAVIQALLAVFAYRFGVKRGRRLGYGEGWRDGIADVKASEAMARRPKERFVAAFREVDSKTVPIDLESKAKETEP